MKKTVLLNQGTLTFSFLLVVLCFGIYSQTAMASDDKKNAGIKEKIWELEQSYLASFRDAAHDKLIPMWHNQFIGWPKSQLQPTGKKEVIEYMKRIAAVPGAWSFVIEKKGIQIVGNVAVTHLTHHITFINSMGKEQTNSTRITHTWINENSEWKILGGMSAQ